MRYLRGTTVAVFLGSLAHLGCDGDAPSTPSGPVVSASPTPTPAPTPTPTPAARTCTLTPMDDCGRSGCCVRGGPAAQFDEEISVAQEALLVSSPDLFNPNGSLAVDEVTYTNALAAKITQLFGLCARGGGGGTSISRDEVAVKRDNNLSQNYDVILGAGNRPYIGEHYSCRPASF